LLSAPGSTSYQYDGNGQRIQQTVSSVVTDYLLDTQPGLAVVLRQTTSGNVDHFIHGPRGVHAHKNYSGNWHYPVPDGLVGSVRGVADDVLAVPGMQHYAPYGEPFGAQGSLGLPTGKPETFMYVEGGPVNMVVTYLCCWHLHQDMTSNRTLNK
jgi:hypothetical protein